MSSISFAQFLYGEIGQESGGNYSAQSPAGALGKYQILASNVPSWSQEILGRSITPQQFLASPQLQDAIAIGMLHKYFTEYGPEGAASAWYTGNPNAWQSGGGGDNYGGPSAAGYVQQVMARAGTYTGDGSELTYNGRPVANAGDVGALASMSNQSTQLGTPPEHMTQQDYEDALGNLASLLTTVPELRSILQEAVQNKWDPSTTFLNAVYKSNWWQQHNDAARQLIGLQLADKAEYNTRIQNAQSQVSNMARQLGVSLNANQISALAQQFIIQGWDSQTLTEQVGKSFNPKATNTPLAGNIATAYQQMKQVYQDYGVPIGDATLRNNALRIAEGTNTIDAYKQGVIASAKSMYPSLAAQLDSGLTVKDIASPYMQQMSSILELDPNSITVNDPLIKKALQGSVVTTNGKATATSTPLWQFEQQLRSDPRWGQTQNARDTMSSALVQVGRDFGFGF